MVIISKAGLAARVHQLRWLVGRTRVIHIDDDLPLASSLKEIEESLAEVDAMIGRADALPPRRAWRLLEEGWWRLHVADECLIAVGGDEAGAQAAFYAGQGAGRPPEPTAADPGSGTVFETITR